VGERRRNVEVVAFSVLTLLNFQRSFENGTRSDRIAEAPYYDAELGKRLCDLESIWARQLLAEFERLFENGFCSWKVSSSS
jgi:hypothetical protein